MNGDKEVLIDKVAKYCVIVVLVFGLATGALYYIGVAGYSMVYSLFIEDSVRATVSEMVLPIARRKGVDSH